MPSAPDTPVPGLRGPALAAELRLAHYELSAAFARLAVLLEDMGEDLYDAYTGNAPARLTADELIVRAHRVARLLAAAEKAGRRGS